MKSVIVLLWFLHFIHSGGGVDLLANSGFELLSDWDCSAFTCTLSTDSFGGTYSYRVSGRTDATYGPSQSVTVVAGNVYAVEIWAKLLNDNGKYQTIVLSASFTMSGGDIEHEPIAIRQAATVNSGWIFLAGEVTAPAGLTATQIIVEGPEVGVEFLVDEAQMSEIDVSLATWEDEANTRIDSLRKKLINIVVTLVGDAVDPDRITVELEQISHRFPFGTAVVADIMDGSGDGVNQEYRDFVYENFNLAVLETALLWENLETTEGNVDYTLAETAIRNMREQGLNIHGVNLLWGSSEAFVPPWVPPMCTIDIYNAAVSHIKDTVKHFREIVDLWVVSSELLHGNWFERKLEEPRFSQMAFRLARNFDEDVKLILNDFDVVAEGTYTESYLSQAYDFLTTKTGISGLGAQCHFSSEPNPILIKRRLDRLGSLGLPIWITQLEVTSDDVDQRADWYETAYRMLFSHPAVEGITIWGFWSEEHDIGEAAALVSGENFTINAAGERIINLIYNEWWTNDTHPLSEGDDYMLQAFQGDYVITVKLDGGVEETKQFTVGDVDMLVNLTVTVDLGGK